MIVDAFSLKEHQSSVVAPEVGDWITTMPMTRRQHQYPATDVMIGARSPCKLESTRHFLANTRRPTNVAMMLCQHRRRWANNRAALGTRIVLVGL